MIYFQGSKKTDLMTMPFYNELFLRVLTALIGVPLVVAIIWLGSPYLDGLAYLLLAGMATEWLALNKKTALISVKGFGIFLSGGLYITTAMVCLLTWCSEPWLILWLLCIVWATDIGAYFVGSYLGGPKLAPSISPGKTWSGFFGGLVCGVAAGWVLYSFAAIALPISLLGTLLIITVASQVGDLIESRVKRHFKVKDSGTIIPGHGGLLDRLDSLLFVAICYKLLFVLSKF
ncbi:CDP-archaeol synthase [Candidatus Finniella inopinata]|uniref:Phosphatidate cytidylyltransferase n=1 Tax=Candidatus Finniella inopinata TaxID=1696036 RepID=A0A4Q7DHW5_9PROT|nr:CDP-archaeol synthase [Candidatus Finniella inopinata]RZI45898.1 CDP-archaeol synthase [Candidatus Finniella inopinata]